MDRNYRREWAEGEIEAGSLLDAIDQLRAEAEALMKVLRECRPAVVREVEKWTRASEIMPVNADRESALLQRIDAAMAAKEG